ncbi:hypothetical protein ACFWCB_05925 [Streptomyces sp. NPDC060048]|uniref:hypothetical protein n=1 Tax=unclassified Streptomyces TaxID=2593676 RepID=UPI0036CC5B37
MDTDIVLRSVLASFDRLSESERSLVEHLCVYRWFDPGIVEYTTDALHLRVDSGLLVRLPMVEPYGVSSEREEFRLRPLLRRHLLDQLRRERTGTHQRAHRLAAAYFHQPLDPFDADRIAWYVEEVHHLAFSAPGRAFARLSAFSHTALLRGYPEAASRAAAEALKPAESTVDLATLAEIIRAVSAILASPARVDDQAVVRLDGLLMRSRPAPDLAASRITRLARDLVTYHSERQAVAATMSAVLAPEAVRGVDRLGMPETSAALAVAEALAHFPRSVPRREHTTVLLGMSKVHHLVKSTVLSRATGSQNTRPVVDLFPLDAGSIVDDLRIRDANGTVITSFTSFDARSAVANAVSYWLTEDDGASRGEGVVVPAHSEISQSLSSALHGMQHEAVGELLLTAAEQTRGPLRERIEAATRYLPLVAQLDTRSGTSQTVEYGYDGPCTIRRQGLIGISVELPLVLPTEIKNRLTLPTPDGVELAGVELDSDGDAVMEPDAAGADQQWGRHGLSEKFTVRFPLPDQDDDGAGPPHRLARATLHLHYVLHRRHILQVRRVNLLCLGICLATTFLPLFLDRVRWASMISVVVSALVMLDAYLQNRRPGSDGSNGELSAFTTRPLHVILGANVFAAAVAASIATLNEPAVTLACSVAALFVCTLSSLALLALAAQRNRLLDSAPENVGRPATARLRTAHR